MSLGFGLMVRQNSFHMSTFRRSNNLSELMQQLFKSEMKAAQQFRLDCS